MLIYSNSCKLIGWMNDSMINEDTLKSPRKIPTTNTQADNQSGMHKKKGKRCDTVINQWAEADPYATKFI